MTDKRLEEIRKRVEAATPGPWEVEDYRCDGDWRSTGNVWARNKGHYHPGTKVCEVNCHSMSSISDPRDIGEEYKDSIYVYKIDTEQEQDLAAAFGIRSIPSVLFIPMNGAPQMAVGAMPKNGFEKAIQDVLLSE